MLSNYKIRLKSFKDKLSKSPISYRLARSAFWALVSGIASRALTIVSSIIVARLLGKEGFGELGMVQSTIGMFGFFAGFGLGATATKYIAEFRVKDRQRAGRIATLTFLIAIITSGIMAVACFCMSDWLAEKTMNRSDLASLIGAGSLLLFTTIISGVLPAVLSGFESFRKMTIISIWQAILSLLITIPLVWLFGTHGAIASLTINAALGILLYSISLKSESAKFGISLQYDKSIWGECPVLWKFSLPSMVAGMVAVPVVWITNIMLVNQPGGYGELGLFNAANQWRMLIIVLPSLLTSGMLPILSESYGKEDKSDFKKAVALNLKVTWVVALPLTVLIITLGKPLALLFGKQFNGIEQILYLLMISCFLSVIGGPVGSALAGAGKMWIGALMNLGWSVALIFATFFLVPSFGSIGLAISYCFAYFLHIVWSMVYLEKRIATSSLVINKWLILFSLILLVVSYQAIFLGSIFSLYSFIVILLSLIPLTRLVSSLYLKMK